MIRFFKFFLVGFLSAVSAFGAGKKISDYTETLSVGDAWMYEIAVPGVTNYKVTFGAMATNIIARAGFTAATSNSVIATVVSLNTNKADNNNGQVTNLTSRGLTLPSLTAGRPLILNSSGNATNASGTPDGTKFLRDDGTLAVPGGGGDVSTAQLNTASNAVISFETTRNAAVSNALAGLLVANDSTTSNSLIRNLNGLGTNLTVYLGVTLPSITANRPLFVNPSGNITNASGTPDGTKFLRDDGALAVPAGSGGDVTTSQLNVSSNALVSLETTRNAAVSNSVVTLISATTNGLFSILVANDTTTSNGLFSVETTRNAAVSNAVISAIANKIDNLSGTGTNLTLRAISGSSTALTVDTNVLVVTGGNVGIGTSTPATKLYIRGVGVSAAATIASTLASGSAVWQASNDVASLIQLGSWGSAASSYGALTAGDVYIYGSTQLLVSSESFIQFAAGTGIPERMRITSGGLVGIGTAGSDPVNMLDVDGAVAIGASYGGGSVAPANGLLVEGTVGVGTASPGGFKLNVNGTAFFATSVETPAVKITTGAADGLFLRSDASGNGAWTAVAASQVYKGTWNATANSPTLANGTGTAGWYYRVVVAGTVDFGAGNITFAVGDDVSYNGTIWQKIPSAGFTLNTATASVLGGIKVGGSLQINADILNITNADMVDITVSGAGSDVGKIWTIDNGAVTYAKIQNVSATSKVLGRLTAGAGVIEELPITGSGNVVFSENPVITGVAYISGLLTVGGTNVASFLGSNFFGGRVQIASGTPGSGKVLTSDATGNASWEPATGGDVTTAQLNTASNVLFTTETTRNAAVSNGVVTLLVANDTTTSNGLYAVETTRNAAVSNALVTLISSAGSTQMVTAAIGTLTVSNALSVGTLNANLLNLTNFLNSNQVRLGVQQLSNVALATLQAGQSMVWNSSADKWTNANLMAANVVSNITVTATNEVLLDFSMANIFKIRLLTNFSYRFTNAAYLLDKGYVYFQQDAVGVRLLNTFRVSGGVLQTNANMQPTTNALALDLMEVMPGLLTTNLICWWPQNFQPRVDFPGSSVATLTDNFDRPASDPMSTTASGGGTWTSGPGSAGDCLIEYNLLRGSSSTDNVARALSPAFANNQSARIQLAESSANFVSTGPMVRIQSATDASGYIAAIQSTTSIKIQRVTDNGSTISYTDLLTAITVPTLVVGDTVTLGVVGTTLTLYVNGVPQGTTRDTGGIYTSGQPGVWFFNTIGIAENFYATDL